MTGIEDMLAGKKRYGVLSRHASGKSVTMEQATAAELLSVQFAK